jgi:RNA recognition motif-containing protein
MVIFFNTDTKEQDLEEIFVKFGKISRCEIKRGTSTDYGFVEYEDSNLANDAVNAHNENPVFGFNQVYR